MNESILRSVGFDKEVTAIKNGKCPMCSSDKVSRNDFKDELSWKEFKISGMCQECQDSIF